jgi:hypothetical protein
MYAEVSKTETVSWWTPQCWLQLPEPEKWRLANSIEGALDSARIASGYRKAHTFGDEVGTNAVEVTIWRCADEPTVVELWDIGEQLTEFFVEQQHLAAFMVDKLPKIISAFATADAAARLDDIRTAIIAFIRHGHGETTINETGTHTLDDRRRERERAAERKRASA